MYGSTKIFDGKIVEQNGVDVGVKDCADLVEAIDLDFEVGGERERSEWGDEVLCEASGLKSRPSKRRPLLNHGWSKMTAADRAWRFPSPYQFIWRMRSRMRLL